MSGCFLSPPTNTEADLTGLIIKNWFFRNCCFCTMKPTHYTVIYFHLNCMVWWYFSSISALLIVNHPELHGSMLCSCLSWLSWLCSYCKQIVTGFKWKQDKITISWPGWFVPIQVGLLCSFWPKEPVILGAESYSFETTAPNEPAVFCLRTSHVNGIETGNTPELLV